ncbi:hypothetical protein G7Y79_00011g030740 [Physcia stellaris]|nr:hypothetical protein G7Y79_00011g030740 [Physcia stellaris]
MTTFENPTRTETSHSRSPDTPQIPSHAPGSKEGITASMFHLAQRFKICPPYQSVYVPGIDRSLCSFIDVENAGNEAITIPNFALAMGLPLGVTVNPVLIAIYRKGPANNVIEIEVAWLRMMDVYGVAPGLNSAN